MYKNVDEHFYFVLNYYKNFFDNNTKVSWYSETIDSLSLSLVEYAKKKNEKDNEPLEIRVRKIGTDVIAPEFAIENQIGLILVLCQTYISNICENVRLFYRDYEHFSKLSVKKIEHKKHELLRNHGVIIGNTKYTDVEIINALSNYFKHHEEWTERNDKLTKKTKEIIKSIGGNIDLNFYWAQNLSKLIGILGINIEQIKNVLLIVDSWKFAIRDSIPELCIELPENWRSY